MKINFTTRQWTLALALILLALYALFQARFVILGPQISIMSPEDGEVIGDNLVVVSGWAKNIAYISLNGRQIFTDEKGFWEEKLLASSGMSIMTVKASDRFGREEEKSVRIISNNGQN